jgi:hypothetical protein
MQVFRCNPNTKLPFHLKWHTTVSVGQVENPGGGGGGGGGVVCLGRISKLILPDIYV